MTEYVCAVDAGGTFTDCILIDESGEVTTAKALTTHDEGVQQGFFDSIDAAGRKLGYDEGEVFDDIVRLAHGTTVATNTVVEDAGVTTGLITTRGHEDTVRMMRGVGRATGEPPENIFEVTEVDKPDPIVPANLIRGVPERVDADGEVVSPLDEAATREVVRDLVDEGVEAIAIALLWAFKNPEHERRVREIVADEAPDVYVSCSHAVAPKVGEYERSVATCINSLVGPETASYVEALTDDLETEYGYGRPLLMMQCNGGNAWSDRVADEPIKLIGSGPVGGLRGCERLVDEFGVENIIATDMGGTSFELGVIQDGDPLVADETVIQKYHYNLPRLDIKSIGAGGGSIAYIAEDTGSLRVGPQSAGAEPGPACYGRGGEQPTVTDANLILGYIDPEAELGDELTPDLDLAREAVGELADELGMTVEATAQGIFDVTNTKMANLMQNEIIGRGFDPREFTVVSYGGAGPIHATSYADELNVETVVVPSDISPVWSAYGIAQSDLLYQFEEEVSIPQPVDPADLESVFSELEARANDVLGTEVDEGRVRYDRVAKMRYKGQVHDLEVSVPNGSLDESDVASVSERFQTQYERRYSPAARLETAVEQFVTLRLEARVAVEQFERETSPPTETAPAAAAEEPSRRVFLDEAGGYAEIDVWDGLELQPGNEFDGPAIVDMPNTSVVVHDGQSVSVNEYYDFEISLQ
ncbi:MAG: hydantoinase/oxoprolinase family protein [Haloarculaceae archaeon]